MQKEKTIILGLGITGLACADYLSREKIPFMALDSRTEPPNLNEFKNRFPNVPVITGQFPPDILKAAETIVLSPGISKEDPMILPHIQSNAKIIGDIELFATSKPLNTKAKKPEIVAITGSNGKSTVTSLVGDMAKTAGLNVGVGGNLGTPALALLENAPDLYVLELSSFQLETTYSLKPAVATLLNICPDHMDRYKTLEEYYQAKARIFHSSERMVVNRDDVYVLERLPKLPYLSFGLNLPNEQNFGVCFKTNYLMQGKTPLISINEMKIFGHHNISNALASLCLGTSLNWPMDAMLESLRTFKGLPHRCEWVRTLNDVKWINDSKGTNVGATVAALEGLKNAVPGKWIVILGGLGKNADFAPLKKPVLESCRAVILIGKATKELEDLLAKEIHCATAKSMEEAVNLARKFAEPGDGVLLSPACASFDMFKNFEHRGDAFKAAVLDLN